MNNTVFLPRTHPKLKNGNFPKPKENEKNTTTVSQYKRSQSKTSLNHACCSATVDMGANVLQSRSPQTTAGRPHLWWGAPTKGGTSPPRVEPWSLGPRLRRPIHQGPMEPQETPMGPECDPSPLGAPGASSGRAHAWGDFYWQG